MTFRVIVPIYRVGIIFIFGQDRKSTTRWLKKEGLFGKDYVDDETLDWCFNDPHEGITCSNDKGNRLCIHVNDVGNHKSIAHEIYHATLKLMDWVGMTPSPENEEAFAYLIGHITGEVYDKIAEHGRRNKTKK